MTIQFNGTIEEYKQFLGVELSKYNKTGNVEVVSEELEEPKNKVSSEPEYVDLGLPSGTLWARCNVGAEKETDYGDYFAWGRVTPFLIGTSNTNDYDKFDASKIDSDLEEENDAATENMGSGWCMPTKEQFDELLANTTSEWTSIGGVNGRKFTASNGNYIFFPASGYYGGSSVSGRGSGGTYWTRSFNSSSGAWALDFGSGNQYADTYDRYYGFSVRGVYKAMEG